jgi:hypothetical protein
MASLVISRFEIRRFVIRLLVAALLAVALLVAVVADFGYSSDEEAYLDEIREQSALVDIAEGFELRQGYAICVALAEIKPGRDREEMARHLLLEDGYTYSQITSATAHLCPDIRLSPEFTVPLKPASHDVGDVKPRTRPGCAGSGNGCPPG